MSVQHLIKLDRVTLPSLSDMTYDVTLAVSVIEISTKDRFVEFVIDSYSATGEYYYDQLIINAIEARYSAAIRSKLLEIQDKIEYDDAEDNGYPDW